MVGTGSLSQIRSFPKARYTLPTEQWYSIKYSFRLLPHVLRALYTFCELAGYVFPFISTCCILRQTQLTRPVTHRTCFATFIARVLPRLSHVFCHVYRTCFATFIARVLPRLSHVFCHVYRTCFATFIARVLPRLSHVFCHVYRTCFATFIARVLPRLSHVFCHVYLSSCCWWYLSRVR